MRMDRIRGKLPTDLAHPHDEARLTLRSVVHATRAHLAEMDRLLDRAERLVSWGYVRTRAARSASEVAT